jgi:hypothetical protein
VFAQEIALPRKTSKPIDLSVSAAGNGAEKLLKRA